MARLKVGNNCWESHKSRQQFYSNCWFKYLA